MRNGKFVDYYDLLMISPQADLEMIEAAVRVMLARWDPKNTKTGAPEIFEQVKHAYLTLSDPHRRARYDAKRNYLKKRMAQDLKKNVPAEEIEAERQKRQGILTVLYQRVMLCPHDHGVSMPQLAEALNLDSDQLHFALWVLREKGWIGRTENGSFAITVEGVEIVENSALSASAKASKTEAGETKARPASSPAESQPQKHPQTAVAAARGKAR